MGKDVERMSLCFGNVFIIFIHRFSCWPFVAIICSVRLEKRKPCQGSTVERGTALYVVMGRYDRQSSQCVVLCAGRCRYVFMPVWSFHYYFAGRSVGLAYYVQTFC